MDSFKKNVNKLILKNVNKLILENVNKLILENVKKLISKNVNKNQLFVYITPAQVYMACVPPGSLIMIKAVTWKPVTNGNRQALTKNTVRRVEKSSKSVLTLEI